MAKAFFITSGRWLRIAPDDSSTPLQTMSYWIALMPRILSWSVGVEREEFLDVACSASRTGCGRSRSSSPPRSIRTSGSRRSSRSRSGPWRSARVPRRPWCARGPRTSRMSAACRRRRSTASPIAEPELIGDLLGRAPARCSWRADPRRPCRRPRARRYSRAPAGPRPAPRRSCGRRTRGCRRFGAGIAQTAALALLARMRAKILKPEPRNASLTFCISIGLRRSGLSVPYLRIASA